MRIRLSWHLVVSFVAVIAVFGWIGLRSKREVPPSAPVVLTRAAPPARSDQAAAAAGAVEAQVAVVPDPPVLSFASVRPADRPAFADASAPVPASSPAGESTGAFPEHDRAGAPAILRAPASGVAAPEVPPATADAVTEEPRSTPAQPGSRPSPTPVTAPDAVRWQQYGTAAINDGKSLNAVAGATGGDFWAAGDGDEVWHFAAGAASWARVPLAQGVNYRDNLNSIYPVPGVPGEAWAVGNAAGILHCTTKICTQAPAVGVTGELDSIWMVSATDGWAVGARGAILHYSGGAWRNVVSRPARTGQLHAVQMLNAGEGFAVGENGEILHDLDGNWTPVETHAKGPLIALWFISPREGWIVGGNNGGPAITYHYLNGEVQPEATAPETANTRLWYVYMFPDGTGWAVANGGYVIRRAATGGWRLAYTAPGGPSIFGVWLDSPDSGWAVAGDGTADHLVRVHF